MPSRAFRKALASDLPVLFVNIGWAIRYDGTEIILGNHRYITENPGKKVGESGAFAQNNGLFHCGIGIGQHTPSPLHIVFVARDPGDQFLKVVGVYVAAEVSIGEYHWGGRSNAVRRENSYREASASCWLAWHSWYAPMGQTERRTRAREPAGAFP
jgi:hypothetical protein